MAIVNGWDDPKPEIQIHQMKSYIFLLNNSVAIENIEWRPLFLADRLKADEVMWRCGPPSLSDEAMQNLRSRREWRGCLIIDVKMATGRFRYGDVVSGSAASPGGQTRDVRLRQVFLHAPSGRKEVRLASGGVADHSTTGDRDVLKESLTTAITFATEQTLTERNIWAVAGDFNLSRAEAADNSKYVSDADYDVDDDDYVHFRRCRHLCMINFILNEWRADVNICLRWQTS